jgi:hypothetical protein
MEGAGFLKNSQIIILGICIAAATVVSSMILSGGALKLMKFTREQISVTGSATRQIRSDYAIWSGSFSRREKDLKTAYGNLKGDLDKVREYFASVGVDPKEVIVSQISTETVYKKNEKGNDTNDIQMYLLTQGVEIRSGDVDRVATVSRESTGLIEKGVVFVSNAPQYFYTDLDRLKIEMLAKASENAKQRAENMVRATGNSIGVIRSARMGVFQITPVTSTDVSDWGENDTTSLDKKVMSVVTASFAIE